MFGTHYPDFINTRAYARGLDAQDPLAQFRTRFFLPEKDGRPLIYFCGNSLGLQPRTARAFIEQEMHDWEQLGVEGHLHAKNPWLYYHHFLEKQTAEIAGAMPIEVVIMNTLTVNINLLLVSFYKPTGSRYKILVENTPFPSDRYAAESHVKYHALMQGKEKPLFHAEDAVIELQLREGESAMRTEDILSQIEQHKDSLALILIGGVNYYSGQLYDMQAITAFAKKCSPEIMVGYDLAHAAGNVELHLHDWNADFASWCSYKYLNSGPGGCSGVFIHERHARDFSIPRFSGWWANREETRFAMHNTFDQQEGAAGWQISNAQILPMAVHRASLDIFSEAGMPALCRKSRLLTGYLEFLLRQGKRKDFRILTPSDPDERGCQLSIFMERNGRQTFDALTRRGVVADWREPGVIRVAPVPLYNTFEEVWAFADIFHGAG